MLSRAFMFGVSGNLDIEYDDIDELKEHPMAAAATVNFTDLFESMSGNSKDEVAAMLSKKDQFLEKKGDDQIKNGYIDFVYELITLLENINNQG